jgi:tetratricopeptide (TPR) repeat protein
MNIFRSSARANESPSTENTRRRHETEQEKLRAKWLSRLVIVAGWGSLIIVIYALPQRDRLTLVGLGFMAAGAAWLSGSLMGFLFGIPHAREGITEPKRITEKKEAPEDIDYRDEEASRYKPSTSLEQISDWLTKIIVGVGLTQLNKIPGKLDGLATYIATGMGPDSANKPFALAILIYFTVCGFLFGFLWSKLYMMKAFAEAETLRRLEEIKSQLDFDTEAVNLVSRQLAPDTPEVAVGALKKAIEKASRATRAAIFDKAKEARNAPGATDDARFRSGPIFRALVSLDIDNYDHESHAQLGAILQDMGKLEDSVQEFTQAIQIRNRRGRTGWTYYDFRRALGRIRLDEGKPSSQETKDQILADLRAAYKDPKRREDFEKRKGDIQNWLSKNGLTYANFGEPQV